MSQDLQASDAKLPELRMAAGEGSHVPTPPPLPPLRRDLRKTAIQGLVIITLFFFVGGGWAAMAPLSGAAIAKGVVSPEGSVQTVQHLEGGIIHEILVREGDEVAKGDTLMVLDDIKAQAEVGALSNRLFTLVAKESRLKAEREGAATVKFEHPELADLSSVNVDEVMNQQLNQFMTRRENDESRQAILQQRIAQNEQQIIGFERQLQGVRRQMQLIREEIKAVKTLFEKGYERKPRLLELQRLEADLLGTEGELMARIARTEETIGETKMQMINQRISRHEEIDSDLSDTQARRGEVEEQIKESLDRLSRTAIVAPVPGTVFNLKFKTPGGVVRPGEAILDVVPADDELIIDARLSPNDIDDVHVGLHAYVMFPSYPQRFVKRISGKVIYVSADALDDQKTGARYYLAKVRVDRANLKEAAPDVVMTPGLPAEAYIATKDRTMLDYLLGPLMQSIERTFRES
jgi:HlyD family type I secretion membrane fusion protein